MKNVVRYSETRHYVDASLISNVSHMDAQFTECPIGDSTCRRQILIFHMVGVSCTYHGKRRRNIGLITGTIGMYTRMHRKR